MGVLTCNLILVSRPAGPGSWRGIILSGGVVGGYTGGGIVGGIGGGFLGCIRGIIVVLRLPGRRASAGGSEES